MLDLKTQLKLIKKNKDISHFYIIFGDAKKNKEIISSFLDLELGFKIDNNLDFFNFSENTLPINKVREIKEINSKTINGENNWRIFFIESNQISIESQNAFLKTLEEPSKNTIFFLFLPNNSFILDTIKSRAQILKGENFSNDEIGKEFLDSNYLNRIKIIKNLDKSEYFLFLNSIDSVFLNNKKSFDNFPEIYKTFLELKNQAQNKGSGIFYILEFLAIYL